MTYTYRFVFDKTGQAGSEMLAFHWTPEGDGIHLRRCPHLHMGSALVRSSLPLIGDRASKLHIPTGVMSVGSMVRFAIEELGIAPLRDDWDEIIRTFFGRGGVASAASVSPPDSSVGFTQRMNRQA